MVLLTLSFRNREQGFRAVNTVQTAAVIAQTIRECGYDVLHIFPQHLRRFIELYLYNG
ncbi:hypothetical protein [Desulfosporosinus sp. I2]|uniref:hypothetical protein n=1 Tax=Desulfosporosinus sp. I2 TaxID=1617025 RepID=UPI001A9A3A5D|nr:hypothetical protein [Desulfosporosinus sp. I2]